MHRGDVWAADLPAPFGRRPVVVLTRDTAIPVLGSVVGAVVTSTVRGHVAEVQVNADEGLRHLSAVNCDNLVTVDKARLVRRLGALGPVKIQQLDDALRLALGL